MSFSFWWGNAGGSGGIPAPDTGAQQRFKNTLPTAAATALIAAGDTAPVCIARVVV
ncbi:hypothetical protein OH809_40980 [Streptomyces sp. NBC_00873]|uniref:hypothetical protein n=1 Tax=unclassified Streptomyces TaxID=2593676 RepID=UPI003870231A|nr:hypothetical protein OH809_40980 [Streptomyces sp. NBC_00873]WTA41709.1 hypothetical protein OH821_02720 [Streptomyces sp. NBC_00842]